jgi:hypothetical protein
MRAPADQKFFERWFVLLAKNKLAAALLPVSGVSIGFFLVMSCHVMPQQFAWYIGLLGVLTISCNLAAFLVVTSLHIYAWAKDTFPTPRG